MYPLFYAKMIGVNLSRLSLGAAMLAMALLASGCATTYFERHLALAQQGHSSSQYRVGIGYITGEDVQKDKKKAFYWIRKSAEGGDQDAQNYLGILYFASEVVKQDIKKAIYWYRKAADQGQKSAQHFLGVLYETGAGVKRDYKKAIYWYRKSADQGDEDAQYSLGILYGKGEGVKRDDKKAIDWYRKAADQGHEDAQNALFDLIKERITRGDKRVLHELVQLAAPQNGEMAKMAKTMLEELLQSGVFIVAEALANEGKAEAQFMLGENYRLGRGVKRNAGLAIFWYKKAAEQGSLKAESEIAKLAN